MAIEFEGVSKRYGRTQALKEVSLRLEKERIYGLLGENGAGKSTLLNILGGRLPQSEGRVTVDGAPAGSDEAQGKVFIVGESNYFPEDMKVKKAFRAAGAFLPGFESEKAVALAGEFGLDMKKRVKALSTGYGSIFRLILGLCSGADYVAFDEPVLGLDARHRDLFYRLLMESYAARPHPPDRRGGEPAGRGGHPAPGPGGGLRAHRKPAGGSVLGERPGPADGGIPAG